MKLRLFDQGKPNGLTGLGWLVWFACVVAIIWVGEQLL